MQLHGSNTCGLHTILNAWAIMLELTPLEEPDAFPTEETYEEARRLINSALRGETTLGTIRSFLVCHGFARAESWESNAGAYAHGSVQTFAMSEQMLESFFYSLGIRTPNI